MFCFCATEITDPCMAPDNSAPPLCMGQIRAHWRESESKRGPDREKQTEERGRVGKKAWIATLLLFWFLQ